MRKRCLLLLPLSLAAIEAPLETTEPIKPWFTGSLLSGSGNVLGKGHINFEPYFFAFARTSFYDNNWKSQPIETLWNLQFRAPFVVGVSNRVDFKISPAWGWNYRNHQSDWVLGDWSAQISFQIHKDSLPHKSWLPSIKFSVREFFPTGKYQKLNPNKLGTDAGGTGAYNTFFALNFSKMLYFYDTHFLNLCFNTAYSIPTKVHVQGFNSYGGGIGTKGVVTPENIFFASFSFEYSLSRNWAIACDFQGVSSSKTRFRGTPGIIPHSDSDIDPAGIPAVNANKAGIQYSVAPAFEYNWSQNLGLIAGVWFTIAGKNSSHFTTGVIALNYYR